MIETFRTDRLIAERLRAEDLEDFYLLYRDPRTMATLGGVRPDEVTRQYLRLNLEHWDRHGFGIWIFRDPEDCGFVGRAGLRHVMIEGHDEVELLYALRADHWGRGLATEISVAILKVGFGELGLSDVVAFTLPSNRASRRVMEKVGFRFERDIVHGGRQHVLYRLVRPGPPAPGPSVSA